MRQSQLAIAQEIDRPATVEAVVERAAGEADDRFVGVVHRHGDAAAGEVVDVVLDYLAVVALELDRELALARNQEIGGAILIAEGVAADHDRMGPARYQPWHVLTYDRLAKDRTADDVANCAVG